MTIKVRNISVNYIQYGEGIDVVLLHGWAQNIEMMNILGKELSNKRITILDFPGFGSSQEPTETWGVEEYSLFLHEFLESVNVVNPIIIGHSFGGRVAICYASLYKVNKLILFGAPCVRTKRELTSKEKLLKGLNKVPGLNLLSKVAKKYIGSSDYKNATIMMRNILVKVVNQDLSSEAKKIKVPSLLIWGDLDTAAPLEEAKLLEKLILDSGLIVLEGCTHYAYIEALPRVISILNQFI